MTDAIATMTPPGNVNFVNFQRIYLSPAYYLFNSSIYIKYGFFQEKTRTVRIVIM